MLFEATMIIVVLIILLIVSVPKVKYSLFTINKKEDIKSETDIAIPLPYYQRMKLGKLDKNKPNCFIDFYFLDEYPFELTKELENISNNYNIIIIASINYSDNFYFAKLKYKIEVIKENHLDIFIKRIITSNDIQKNYFDVNSKYEYHELGSWGTKSFGYYTIKGEDNEQDEQDNC